MSNTTIEERKVTDKQIKDSYKGILRIAPFFDVSDIKDDNYKNKNLYCYDECDILSSHKSQVSAYHALIGNSVRYNFPDDELKHCRLPVTDSVGNYLNWNVGLNGVTIGSQESNDIQSEFFQTENICVGLEKNKSNKTNQSENGGTVIINSYLKIGDVTLLPTRNVQNGDGIIQNNDKNADYENIDDLIDNFIKKIYKNGFIKEVPSGSVIYHAATLEDWRTKNINDDDDIAMQQGTDDNLIQGTSRIEKNNTVKYKRDYLLCDGSIYKLIYVPKNFSIKGDIYENREKFFELFFNIGYTYTERHNIAKRIHSIYDKTSYRYVPILDDYTTQIFKPLEWDNFKNTDFTKLRQYNFSPFIIDKNNKKISPVKILATDEKYNNLDDIDVLFQEDLATMLCCDEIYDYVRNYQKTNNGKLPSDYEINNMLEGKSIPEEYIFNSFIRDSKGQSKWSLPDGVADKSIEDVIEISFQDENDKITVLLGKEINKFGQNIKFYSPSEETYKQCKIWRLPLITLFKRLLLLGLSDKDLLPYFHYFYSFNFQVPKLVSDDYTPTFIGSGAYMIAKNNSKNTNKVKSWSGTTNTYKITPHRHFISLSEKNKNGNYISYNEVSNGTYPFANSLTDYMLKPLNEDNILVSEYCDYRIDSQLPDVYNDSYILGDFESSLSSKTIYNNTESFVANEEPDRGLSGEAIFTEESLGNDNNKANKTNFPNSTSKYFFSMKNITYLPLIKI